MSNKEEKYNLYLPARRHIFKGDRENEMPKVALAYGNCNINIALQKEDGIRSQMSIEYKTKNRKFVKLHKKTGSQCIVCDEKFENEKFVKLHKTRRQTHSLCINCAVGYLTPVFKIAKNNIRKNIRNNIGMFKCPGTYHSESRNACKTIIDLKKLKIPDENLSMDLFRINYVMDNEHAYMCPNEDCGNIVDVDKEYTDNQLLCIMCNTTWCKNCVIFPYHKDKSCLEYESEMKNTENGKLIWKLKQKGELKFCPQCKTPIKKGDGCNRITCSQCKASWCWLCDKLNIEYDHYNEKNTTKCVGKLWEGVDEFGNALVEPVDEDTDEDTDEEV